MVCPLQPVAFPPVPPHTAFRCFIPRNARNGDLFGLRFQLGIRLYSGRLGFSPASVSAVLAGGLEQAVFSGLSLPRQAPGQLAQLQQQGTGDVAGGVAQDGHGGRCREIIDVLEVHIVIVQTSVNAAAGQDGVADTGLQGQSEPHGQIQGVQFFQQAPGFDLLQLLQVVGKLVSHRQLADFDDFILKAQAG